MRGFVQLNCRKCFEKVRNIETRQMKTSTSFLVYC